MALRVCIVGAGAVGGLFAAWLGRHLPAGEVQLSALARAKSLAVAVLSIRHLVLPLVALALSRLFKLSDTQTTVLLLFSALPTASSCYVLAARMGGNGAYVAGLVTVSTLIAMVGLPVALLALGWLR